MGRAIELPVVGGKRANRKCTEMEKVGSRVGARTVRQLDDSCFVVFCCIIATSSIFNYIGVHLSVLLRDSNVLLLFLTDEHVPAMN